MARAPKVSVPVEPTLLMAEAYMRAVRFSPGDIKRWMAYLQTNIGTTNECAFVTGLRAAIAVGAGRPAPEPAKRPIARKTP